MDEREFKALTKKMGLDVIRLVETPPRSRTTNVVARQLLRAATSVGANYRAACRGKSTPDVMAKLAIVEEEADETSYWLEVLLEAGIVPEPAVRGLLASADSIVAMTVASIRTMRKRSSLAAAGRGPSAIQKPKPKTQNETDNQQ